MPVRSDFFETAALERILKADAPQRAPGDIYDDEWAVGQKATAYSWDEVVHHPLTDLPNVDAYRFPDIAAPERFARLAPFIRQARDVGKYIVAADPVLLYERAQALLGFEQLLIAPHTEPERLAVLLDRLADLTIAAIEQFAGVGAVDGFMTWQDFASQTEPHMRIGTFREFYTPRYARIAEAAHRHGMHYIWHTCGQVLSLIPELIEVGVDVVQLDQPRLLGHRVLAERFGGKVCFWNTVDIQWATSGRRSPAEIRAEVAAMTAPFRGCGGGLMARHYSLPSDIGLSPEFHAVTYAAFLENGCALSPSA